MTTLAPGYEPKDFESRLYAEWEASGVFTPQGDGPAYSILLPPPNVTGTLHMGHAFQHTLQDALIRYHRMRGYKTLWQMGTDHAGIATEMVVSRNLQIAGTGETRDSLGRDKFIDKVWEWKAQSGGTIERQMRRLGTSGDWTRSVFTMDDGASNAVIEAFVKLYEEGLIYRGQRLVNWDPVLKTAISDLEVVSEEEDGFLWSLAYPLTDGSGSLVVATTRPETMLGDTAVMVHPEDERYAHLIGKTVTLPLTNREIPIIADDYVDREFGTGVVKVTPAHDFNDYAVGFRHGLICVNIFSPTAKLWRADEPRFLHHVVVQQNSSLREWDLDQEPSAYALAFMLLTKDGLGALVEHYIPKKYQGLDRYDARKAVLADLEEAGLLTEIKPHKLQVPRGDRTGQVIEPYLTDQWFVTMSEFARRGLELAENGSTKFVPPNWINTYRHWMENIQDWCISRQLWWGHRIPAWYISVDGTRFESIIAPVVARNEFDARILAEQQIRKNLGDDAYEKIKGKLELTQDEDVLETWFSSALWPISTMGWPNPESMQERGFNDFVPSSVLVTGFDIIFFWVARMIMMTDHFMPKDAPDAARVPFKDVYITGLVRDKDGQKMSKSKGNVLDPLDIIDGITADELVAKRTTGLMKPKDAPKIEKHTRKEFPDGIAPHGADALRFTMAALAGPGRDIKFDMARCEGYKNFCNKLWNATRFVLMNTEGFSLLPPAGEGARRADEGIRQQPITDAEKWILSRLAKVSADASEHFAAYRFDLLAQALYEFAWNEFCDWFVELAKPALNGDDKSAADSTRHTLLHVLESLLRLLHPLTPFVTEELWRNVAPKLGIEANSISTRAYPQASDFAGQDYSAAETDIEWLKDVVKLIRRMRGENNIPPSRRITVIFNDGDTRDGRLIERFARDIEFLGRAEKIVPMLPLGQKPPAFSAMLPLDGLQIMIPLDGIVDPAQEIARLAKEIKRLESELLKARAKLDNENFVRNAPPEVILQERDRVDKFSTELTRTNIQHDALRANHG